MTRILYEVFFFFSFLDRERTMDYTEYCVCIRDCIRITIPRNRTCPQHMYYLILAANIPALSQLTLKIYAIHRVAVNPPHNGHGHGHSHERPDLHDRSEPSRGGPRFAWPCSRCARGANKERRQDPVRPDVGKLDCRVGVGEIVEGSERGKTLVLTGTRWHGQGLAKGANSL